jgi:hypothetical protein
MASPLLIMGERAIAAETVWKNAALDISPPSASTFTCPFLWHAAHAQTPLHEGQTHFAAA